MSEELLAVSKVSPAAAAQADYDSICAALMHTERGRWFLEEYAKRNRTADTKLLLTAIERIEAVVCAERSRQAQQGFRTDLLEMAEAITRTRAEVAEIRSDSASPPDGATEPLPRLRQPRDVFAAAERIRDVTWAMRGHGFDPSTCDQLEELAASILSASSLRDPTDRRAAKLSEVLRYLEHRIDALLDSCTDGDGAVPEPAPETDPDAFEPAVAEEAMAVNGFAGSFVAAPGGHEAADFGEAPTSPPSRQTDLHGAPRAVDLVDAQGAQVEAGNLEGEAASPVPAAEIALQEAPLPPLSPPDDLPPDPELASWQAASAAEPGSINISPPESDLPRADAELSRPRNLAGQPELPISAQNHGLDAQSADDRQSAAAASRDHPVAAEAESPPSIDGRATKTGTKPQDALSPTIKLVDSSQLLPNSPELHAASSLCEAARPFLPEIDMRSDTPGLGAAWGRRLPPVTAMPDFDGQRIAATGTAKPTGLDPAQPAPAQPPSPAKPSPPAATTDAPASRVDPLAALKAMSDDELIALFT